MNRRRRARRGEDGAARSRASRARVAQGDALRYLRAMLREPRVARPLHLRRPIRRLRRRQHRAEAAMTDWPITHVEAAARLNGHATPRWVRERLRRLGRGLRVGRRVLLWEADFAALTTEGPCSSSPSAGASGASSARPAPPAARCGLAGGPGRHPEPRRTLSACGPRRSRWKPGASIRRFSPRRAALRMFIFAASDEVEKMNTTPETPKAPGRSEDRARGCTIFPSSGEWSVRKDSLHTQRGQAASTAAL